MNKRPKEVKEAISRLYNCSATCSIPATKAWQTVYEYITDLESTIQTMITAEERNIDDGR